MMAGWICYCFALFFFFNPYSSTAQLESSIYHPTANISITWKVTDFVECTININILPVLLRGTSGPSFACGFYCIKSCASYLFAIFIVLTTKWGDIITTVPPQVVWSANRDSPVGYGAILNFTSTGELVLKNVDGSTVWSTNTTEISVVGMNLTDAGNLVLFVVNGSVVWQSFDYPTDSLVLGQRLFQGQQLIPSVSSYNWMAQRGLYSLQVTDERLVAYAGSNTPQVYYETQSFDSNKNKERKYVRFLNGSLSFFFSSAEPGNPDDFIAIPEVSSAQYMKFMPDGHLKVWKLEMWQLVADLLTDIRYGECTYPLACGRNAICSNNQQCSCPVSTIDSFRAVNNGQPNLGCSAITPLRCNAIRYIQSPFTPIPPDIKNVSMETCKLACLTNCSCKAAVFKYDEDSSNGSCHLPTDLFTMINIVLDQTYRLGF